MYSPNSPFEIIIDKKGHLKIGCFGENSTILIPAPNSKNESQILINIQQFLRLSFIKSKLKIILSFRIKANRTISKNIIDSSNLSNGIDKNLEQILLVAHSAEIKVKSNLKSEKNSFIEINANNSQMRIESDTTQVMFFNILHK